MIELRIDLVPLIHKGQLFVRNVNYLQLRKKEDSHCVPVAKPIILKKKNKPAIEISSCFF